MPLLCLVLQRILNRRFFVALPAKVGLLGVFAMVLCGGLLINAGQSATTADPKITPGGISLKEALEKGLKARRKSEFAFIKLVVQKVEQGKLSSKMVERTFLWARNNHQPFPMPYFEKALQIQAKKIGVSLPFTDT
jgi:hypothetical protein